MIRLNIRLTLALLVWGSANCFERAMMWRSYSHSVWEVTGLLQGQTLRALEAFSCFGLHHGAELAGLPLGSMHVPFFRLQQS